MLNVLRINPFLILLVFVAFSGCTPAYEGGTPLQPGTVALGDDLIDGTGEFRSYPEGTKESVKAFLEEKLPCNHGTVDNLHARLLKAGCSDLFAITSYGQDGKKIEQLNPLCPVDVLEEERAYFIENSICMAPCLKIELKFTLGVQGCSFHDASSMIQY